MPQCVYSVTVYTWVKLNFFRKTNQLQCVLLDTHWGNVPYFSSCSTTHRFQRAGLILEALSTTKLRDWGEDFLKGTVTLKVSSLRRRERDGGKKSHNAYSHLAGSMLSHGCQACQR